MNKPRRKTKHVHNTLSSFDRFVIFCVGIRLRVDSSCSINRDITLIQPETRLRSGGEKAKKRISSQPLFLAVSPRFLAFVPTEEPGSRLLHIGDITQEGPIPILAFTGRLPSGRRNFSGCRYRIGISPLDVKRKTKLNVVSVFLKGFYFNHFRICAI